MGMKLGTQSPNQVMMSANVTSFDLVSFVEHLANILETQGSTVVDAVRTGLNLVQFITSRNISGIIASLTVIGADFKAIAKAIRDEFGL